MYNLITAISANLTSGTSQLTY